MLLRRGTTRTLTYNIREKCCTGFLLWSILHPRSSCWNVPQLLAYIRELQVLSWVSRVGDHCALWLMEICKCHIAAHQLGLVMTSHVLDRPKATVSHYIYVLFPLTSMPKCNCVQQPAKGNFSSCLTITCLRLTCNSKWALMSFTFVGSIISYPVGSVKLH